MSVLAAEISTHTGHYCRLLDWSVIKEVILIITNISKIHQRPPEQIQHPWNVLLHGTAIKLYFILSFLWYLTLLLHLTKVCACCKSVLRQFF